MSFGEGGTLHFSVQNQEQTRKGKTEQRMEPYPPTEEGLLPDGSDSHGPRDTCTHKNGMQSSSLNITALPQFWVPTDSPPSPVSQMLLSHDSNSCWSCVVLQHEHPAHSSLPPSVLSLSSSYGKSCYFLVTTVLALLLLSPPLVPQPPQAPAAR